MPARMTSLLNALVLCALAACAACQSQASKDLERASAEVGEIQWGEGGEIGDKLQTLSKLDELLQSATDSAVKPEQLTQARQAFASAASRGVIEPVKSELEHQLSTAIGKEYIKERASLKTYLLLADREHLKAEREWFAAQLVKRASEILAEKSKLSPTDLRARLVSIVMSYVELLASGAAQGQSLDKAMIERVRDRLRRAGSMGRYYDRFVTVLIDERIDPEGPRVPRNLKYPPVSLRTLFDDRPPVLRALRSKRFTEEKKWQVVRGAYTAPAFHAVRLSLEDARTMVTREAWVTASESAVDADANRVIQSLDRVWTDYQNQYIVEWSALFRDIELVEPKTAPERAELIKLLVSPEWPYLRLLKVLSDHTVAMHAQSAAKKAQPSEIIRKRFASMVSFGVPAKDQQKTPLSEYIEALRPVLAELESGGGFDAKAAETKTRELLYRLDEPGQALMTPLLLGPLGVKK